MLVNIKCKDLSHNLEDYLVQDVPLKQLLPYIQTAVSMQDSKHSSKYQGRFLQSVNITKKDH